MPSSNRRTRRGNAAAASVAGGLLAALPGGVADADMRCSWLNAPNAQSKHVRGSGQAFPALATPYFWCGRRLVRFDDQNAVLRDSGPHTRPTLRLRPGVLKPRTNPTYQASNFSPPAPMP